MYTQNAQQPTQYKIVMEYMDAGSLADLVSYHKQIPMTELQVRFVVWSVLKGLNFIHGMHRIHRDIKSDNVLLTAQGNVKIGSVQSPSQSYHLQAILDFLFN